ncbi:hypothetical protein VNO78_20883 [Psophocarpus tetragonolobus]|uniref:AMP-activated protein kinase glycogen-binding domain-containing protein n=1 Tax=Psophocarpus tetragonolobus TaxID=3891 RepID=A0AAN9SBR3_PSOTE
MGSVWVCYFPSCTTFPCGECNVSPSRFLQPSTSISLRLRSSQTATTRTSTRKSRRKTDAEICIDIRQFLASVGLPEDHIPSTKELLLHGWNDLANIVRRRGHKQIQELLSRSILNADVHCFEDPLAGQSEKVDSLVDDVEASTEFQLGNSSGKDDLSEVKDHAEVVNHVIEESFLPTEVTVMDDEGTSITEEPLVNLYVEDGISKLEDHAKVVNNVTEENFYPTEVTVVDDDSVSSREGLYPNFGAQSSLMPTEISGELPFKSVSTKNFESEESLVGKMVGETTLSLTEKQSLLKQKDLDALEGLDDDNDDIVEDVATTSEVSVTENFSADDKPDSIFYSIESSSTNLDTSANLSLKEKVATFIQNGDLEPVEGTHPPEDNSVVDHGNSLDLDHGKSLTSEQVVESGLLDLDQPLGDDHLPHEDLTTHFDKDMKIEAPKVQNESEINHLKFMLYQKELELSRLKGQIEKEKLALSVLQTKAEAEISKARKLISAKDAELHVAEESLSGLKEVQIELYGDGDVVEVAGSFNGWHQRIKLDPQPSTSAIDLDGSRRSRVWSTMLWLYPGVYEIKFIVDGKWLTDSQRESVTRGHICNNILRVDR